jgi:hypothetical protein
MTERCPETGKLCLSQKDAGSIINSARRHNSAKNIPKRSYYCSFCGAYHVTHNKAGMVDSEVYYRREKR